MVTAKACTKCGETKPLGAFYRRGGGDEKRRAACKACELAAAKHRRKHPPILSQIVAHHANPTAPLSPEAEAAIYTTDPIDSELLKHWRERQEKGKQAEARRLRRLKREAEQNPMSYAARCYARMVRG